MADGIPNAEALLLNAALDGFAADVAAPDAAALRVSDLVAGLDLGELWTPVAGVVPPPPLALPPERAEALLLDLRLALVMLSQTYGDDGNATVLAAQTDPARRALVIREGTLRPADLLAHLQALGLPADMENGLVRLPVPLVLWPGSALVIRDGEGIALSRADGAFIISFGDLVMTGGTIAGVGPVNSRARSFRPFVTTADAGSVTLQGGMIRDLGFGDTLKFAGFSVLRSLLHQPARPAFVMDTTFTGLRSFAIGGDQGMVVQDNRFHDLVGPGLVVSRTDDVRITGNLFYGVMPTNAIRLDHAARHALVAGNLILGGDRAGIVIRDGSRHATVTGNLVWQRDGGGINLIDADCGQIAGNLVLDNDQKGIEVRGSVGVTVTANTILSNHSAAVWISNQDAGTQTLIADNRISFNGSGLATALGAELWLERNDFSLQYQQFLSGDLTPQSPAIARDLRNVTPLVLTAAASRVAIGAPIPPAACTE
jgi:mannuronan 5-epimerase